MLGKPIMRSAFNATVTFQKLGPTVTKGDVSNDYVTVACLPAVVKARSSMTIKEADRLHEGGTHLVTIDYRPDVGGGSRFILPDGRTLDVVGIPRRDQEGNPRFLECDCTEKV